MEINAQTESEREMALLLVSALNLDIRPDQIAPEAALFGHEALGLGLDSIDALEIALAIQQKYGAELRADDANPDDVTRQIFGSLRALTAHVAMHRTR